MVEDKTAEKRTVLPPMDREDMIALEARLDIERNYKMSFHDPATSPNFAKKVEERAKKIRDLVNPNSPVLTGDKVIPKQSPKSFLDTEE